MYFNMVNEFSHGHKVVSNTFAVLGVPFRVQSDIFHRLSDRPFCRIMVLPEKDFNFVSLFIGDEIFGRE